MYTLLLLALTLPPVNFPTPGSDSVLQLRERAIQDDSNAQFWLGIAYERGRGVRSDQRKALYWILRSANAGNPDAQNWMGQAYEEGKGI